MTRRIRNDNYGIAEFYYNKFSDDKYKNADELKQAILGTDTKGTAKKWMAHSGWTKNVAQQTGRNIQTKIDDVNQKYFDKITAEVSKANTEDDLNAIKTDAGYEVIDEVESMIMSTKETIGPSQEEVEDEINDILKNTKRQPVAVGEYTTGYLKRRFGKAFADKINDAIHDRASELYDEEVAAGLR